MRLLDIGANFGVMTLAALRYGGQNARVVAVEPSATSARILRANLKLAGESARATVLQVAAGDSDGILEMLTTGAAGEHYLVAADGHRPDAISIRKLTLAAISQRCGVVPTHVKIDVEGFEDEVIRGGLDFLRIHRPMIFLELHGKMLRDRGRNPRDVLENLRRAEYGQLLHAGEEIGASAASTMDIARLVCISDSGGAA
jgi:FkbM family methyltransferase